MPSCIHLALFPPSRGARRPKKLQRRRCVLRSRGRLWRSVRGPMARPQSRNCVRLIKQQLAMRGCEVISDRFTAQTPDGPVPMENIIAKFPGKIRPRHRHHRPLRHEEDGELRGRERWRFFHRRAAGTRRGACRAGPASTTFTSFSSTAKKRFHEWTDTDSLYGSRHLAAKWTADGTNRRLKALINVDMTGDKNLRLIWDTNSARFAA